MHAWAGMVLAVGDGLRDAWAAVVFYAMVLYAVHLLASTVRRVGRTPHCRQCGYNLTGCVSFRCPECGQSFESFGYDVGVRKFRPLRFAIGLLLLGYGAAMLWMLWR